MALDPNREFAQNEIDFLIKKIDSHAHLESFKHAINTAKEFVAKQQYREARQIFSGLERTATVLEEREAERLRQAQQQPYR